MTITDLWIFPLIWSVLATATLSVTIGIDLGTTYSCVGVMESGKVEIIPNHKGNRITPCIVSFTDDELTDNIFIGDDVQNEIITNPNNTVYEIKRLIGRKYDSKIKDYFESLPFQIINGSHSEPLIQVNYDNKSHQYTPEYISSMILGQLKQTAEAYVGQTVKEAVITVPAYFNDDQKAATKTAASLAGLDALRLVYEPVASAIAYGMDKMHRDATILVYHLGGNTLDVTLLEVDEGVFEIVATAGDDQLGGKNFDENVLNYFVKVFKRKNKIDINNNERAKAKLRRELSKATNALSSTTKVRIEIENLVDGVDFSETFTRARFEELNKDLFSKTLESIEKVLKDADIKREEVNEIILSGGSTRIPKIQQLIKNFFGGKEANRGINADEAVCYGAAVQAGILGIWQKREPLIMDCNVGYGHDIVLNGQNVAIDINNNYASIVYSFEFENTNRNRADELQYELNIDSGAYISYFIGEIDGVVYKGITKEKKKAAKEYQKAKQECKNAILVSQDHNANTFKIKTNIQPGSKAILNITVEQLLVRTFGFYELSLDISNIDNNFKSKSKVIPIQINLTDSNDVKEVEIPFGEYDVVDNDAPHTKKINAEITKQPGKKLSYFIFRYKSKTKDNKYNQMIFDSKSNTFLHKFGFDEENEDVLPRRVVFVLDKSGSMWGIWEKAQEAIIGAIANIKNTDRFGIVLFDSNVDKYGIEGGSNRDKAIDHIKNTEPGSATNLYAGIESAMSMIVHDIKKMDGDNPFQYVNQIIFVSDGMANVGVTDPDRILQNIYNINSKLRASISIFGIGIGEDHGNEWVDFLNYPLIRKISIQNGGFDKRIKISETRESLEKYYKILESPQLSYIDVNYESEKYEINKLTQRTFNTLYAGTDIVICGKLENKTKGKGIEAIDATLNAVITANGGEKMETEFVLNTERNNNDIDVERIWAYLSLKNYENLLLQNEGKIERMRRLINENALNLALTFKLVTPWTSMIVVEEKLAENVDINGDDDEWKQRQMPPPQHHHEYGYEQTQGILLLDVTPLSLGIEIKGGIMMKLIEKNSVIPTKKSIKLTGIQLPQIDKSKNNDISGSFIRIVQGEKYNVSDNIILGEYILNGKFNETINVEVIFEIDANGILYVQSVDDINGEHFGIIITADKGRPSQEQIDEMLRSAEESAEREPRMTETIQAMNGLESAAYNLKNWLQDKEKSECKLSDKDEETLFEAANDVIDWLDDNTDADRDDYNEKQQEFDDIIQPILKEFCHDYYKRYYDNDDDDYYYIDHEDL